MTEDRRSGPDVASLLVELGRLIRACRFYDRGHATLAAAFRRAVQAFQNEIDRHGPLEVKLDPHGFRFDGTALAPELLDETARDLAARGIAGFRLEAPLDADAFAAFVRIAASDVETLEDGGGPCCALERYLVSGVEILERGSEADTHALADAAAEPQGELFAEIAPETLAGNAQTALDEVSPEIGFAPEETPLRALLRELTDCEDNASYARLTDQVVAAAERAARTGHPEQAYRAVLVAHQHAGDDGKRGPHQRKLAAGMFRELLRGPALAEVMERACSDDPGSSILASQLLLEAGEGVVPALLDGLDRAEDPERRERLRSMLIALGEEASQPLLEVMAGQDRRLARSAVRLLGELQHPRAVEWLEDLVAGSEPVLRHEAVMALSRIAGSDSLRVLLQALSSPVRDVQLFTLQALGGSGRPKAVGPLSECLLRELKAGDLELALEAIRALGRLGREEATPALGEVLSQRRLLGRGRLRELKLAALAALARIPGAPAATLLESSARERDPGLRRAAETALRRRGAVDRGDHGG